MLRTIVLSIMVLIGVAFTLPFTNSLAESAHAAASHRMHRHSRAWWRRRRARQRMNREAALRRREASLAASNTPNANAPLADLWATSVAATPLPNADAARAGAYNNPSASINLKMPEGWSSQAASLNGDMRFRVLADNQIAGQAMLSLIPANLPANNQTDDGGAMGRRSNRLLGRFAHADLRRLVINKMVAAGGWVVNDYERLIGGRKSFVVLAQTPASGDGRSPTQSWTFYFTERNDRVYSLQMSTLPQYANQLIAQSEQLLASFHASDNAVLASTPGH